MSKIVPLRPGGPATEDATSEYVRHLKHWLSPHYDEPVRVCELLDVAADLHATLSEAFQKAGLPPLPRRAGGRPPKDFVTKLAIFGAAWLAANGVPHSQTDLVRALEERCDERGWEYSNPRLRAMASELIAEFQEQLES